MRNTDPDECRAACEVCGTGLREPMLWRVRRPNDLDPGAAGSPGGSGRIPFRLRIGVTGHRDLEDVDALAGEVRDRLGKIVERFPTRATTPIVITILSSLADGADQLVAREALSLLGDDGVELQAVLPVSLERYRKNFPDPTGFEELFRKASRRTQMPYRKAHAAAYGNAGRFIVDHSDVMIALWDGCPSEREGGTAEIVAYAREQHVCLLVVPTRRTQHPHLAPRTDAGATDPLRELAPAREAFEHIAKYNKRSANETRFERDLSERRARLGALLAESPAHPTYEEVAAWALPHLVRANHLALRYQWWYKRFGEMLYLFAALAVTAVAAQSQYGLPTQVALLEVGFMVSILAVYFIAKHWLLQDRWLGYRSLAEAFRSGLFMALAGAAGRSVQTTDGVVELATPAETLELDDLRETWHQRAFSEAWSRRPRIDIERPMAADLRRFLVEGWIAEQIGYHHDVARRARRTRKAITWALFALFGVTIAAGTTHGLELASGPSWRHLSVFLGIALPGFGAALVGLRDLRRYGIHEHRSTRTAERLRRLERERSSKSGVPALRQLAEATQFVIYVESHDWSGVVEFQRLELAI